MRVCLLAALYALGAPLAYGLRCPLARAGVLAVAVAYAYGFKVNYGRGVDVVIYRDPNV